MMKNCDVNQAGMGAVSPRVLEQIAEFGFAFALERVNGSQLQQLEQSLITAVDSRFARKRAGDIYALRNILKDVPGIYEFAFRSEIFDTAQALLGEGTRPVKAILFDKTQKTNWNLRWHQDNVISVRERKDVPGFTAWSTRVGIPHVRPPVEILQGMLAARIHIDDCPAENGALQVIPATHNNGRLTDEEIEQYKCNSEQVICTAERGGIFFMRPLLLHSSRPSTNPSHRRILHIEYASSDLPGGLEWGA